MEAIHDIADSAWEAAHNVALEVIDGKLLHEYAPWSPHVPPELAMSMPDLTGRLPLMLPWQEVKPVNPEEHYVWLLDNTAFRPSSVDQKLLADIENKDENADASDRDPSQNPPPWQAEYVAAYFVKYSGRDISKVVADVAQRLGIAEDDAARKTIKQRIEAFVDTVLPRHTVTISKGGAEHTLGPSSASGISSVLGNIHLDSPSSSIVTNSFPGATADHRFLPGATVLAEPTGWGIISDIDDTIKITFTPSATGVLRSTFIDTPTPVKGMPPLYSHLASALSQPAFFYLSASPYNLYPFLRRFREDHYPRGTIILRDASWQNLGGLLESLTQDVQAYKVDRMCKIHAWFPSRAFVCFGDSTQKDPESYGEIARTFPGWVRAIFIRKVEGVSDVTDPDQERKNSPERFESAFKGLDRGLWHVFSDPDEVRPLIDAVVAEGL